MRRSASPLFVGLSVRSEYNRRALAFLDQAPEADTCLHGDFHIGNIITDGKRTLWIFKPVSALIHSTVALSTATLATSMGLSMYFRTECRALIASMSSMSLIYTFFQHMAKPNPTLRPSVRQGRPLRRSFPRRAPAEPGSQRWALPAPPPPARLSISQKMSIFVRS